MVLLNPPVKASQAFLAQLDQTTGIRPVAHKKRCPKKKKAGSRPPSSNKRFTKRIMDFERLEANVDWVAEREKVFEDWDIDNWATQDRSWSEEAPLFLELYSHYVKGNYDKQMRSIHNPNMRPFSKAYIYSFFQTLRLANLKIAQVDPEFVQLTNLEELSLTGNILTKVENLPKSLTTLHLNANKLVECPPLGSMLNLFYVGLAYNQITSLVPQNQGLMSLAARLADRNSSHHSTRATRLFSISKAPSGSRKGSVVLGDANRRAMGFDRRLSGELGVTFGPTTTVSGGGVPGMPTVQSGSIVGMPSLMARVSSSIMKSGQSGLLRAAPSGMLRQGGPSGIARRLSFQMRSNVPSRSGSIVANRISMAAAAESWLPPNLVSLDLSFNCLEDLDTTVMVLQEAPFLRILTMTGNPICLIERYRSTICAKLVDLMTLDEVPVKSTDRVWAVHLKDGVAVGILFEVTQMAGVPPTEPPPPPEDHEQPPDEYKYAVCIELKPYRWHLETPPLVSDNGLVKFDFQKCVYFPVNCQLRDSIVDGANVILLRQRFTHKPATPSEDGTGGDSVPATLPAININKPRAAPVPGSAKPTSGEKGAKKADPKAAKPDPKKGAKPGKPAEDDTRSKWTPVLVDTEHMAKIHVALTPFFYKMNEVRIEQNILDVIPASKPATAHSGATASSGPTRASTAVRASKKAASKDKDKEKEKEKELPPVTDDTPPPPLSIQARIKLHPTYDSSIPCIDVTSDYDGYAPVPQPAGAQANAKSSLTAL